MKIKEVNPFHLPILMAQGLWVRLTTPRLPGAAGPCEGLVPGDAPELSIAVLGESPVAGIGAPDHGLALTGQIARSLNRRQGRAVRWLALGRSGANARQVRDELVPHLRGRRTDGVVIVLGVNDAIELNSPEKWKSDMRSLIGAVRNELGAVRIVLAGAPPLDSFPALPARLRSFLGARSRRLDRELAALAAELPDVVHQPMLDGLRDEHFCADGFHPGVSGYALWGDHLSIPLLEG
ncbi:MAG: SGNH/GDSL hydrolase family protein [Blastocatellales bacterium]